MQPSSPHYSFAMSDSTMPQLSHRGNIYMNLFDESMHTKVVQDVAFIVSVLLRFITTCSAIVVVRGAKYENV